MKVEFDLRRVKQARRSGQQVIAVIGLGFVGTAVVANLARAKKDNRPLFFVIGVDQDTPVGRTRASRLNEGLPPVYASDESLTSVIRHAFSETENLVGTVEPD